ERRDFRGVVVDDVWLIGMKRGVILMVGFGRIERAERRHLSDDGVRPYLCLRQQCDVTLRRSLLLVVRVPDGRAILRTTIRSLVVELRRVMRNGEEHLQQLFI